MTSRGGFQWRRLDSRNQLDWDWAGTPEGPVVRIGQSWQMDGKIVLHMQLMQSVGLVMSWLCDAGPLRASSEAWQNGEWAPERPYQ